VSRYFLNLRNGDDVVLDPDGHEFETEAELAAAMLLNVRDMMKADVEAGRLDLRPTLDAQTADGCLVLSLSFLQAVEIIHPAANFRRAAA
jgi:hypothetical protein